MPLSNDWNRWQLTLKGKKKHLSSSTWYRTSIEETAATDQFASLLLMRWSKVDSNVLLQPLNSQTSSWLCFQLICLSHYTVPLCVVWFCSHIVYFSLLIAQACLFCLFFFALGSSPANHVCLFFFSSLTALTSLTMFCFDFSTRVLFIFTEDSRN